MSYFRLNLIDFMYFGSYKISMFKKSNILTIQDYKIQFGNLNR